MHSSLVARPEAIAALCRRHGVAHPEMFGSAARGGDFDPARSDADLLVEFGHQRASPSAFLDFKQERGALLGRPVDLVERSAVEASRTYIRRRSILADAESVYAD